MISLQDSDDLSHTPSSDNRVIVGGDKTSKEQSLPPNPNSQVQFPDEHIPRLLQLFGHKLTITVVTSGCSFTSVEFSRI